MFLPLLLCSLLTGGLSKSVTIQSDNGASANSVSSSNTHTVVHTEIHTSSSSSGGGKPVIPPCAKGQRTVEEIAVELFFAECGGRRSIKSAAEGAYLAPNDRAVKLVNETKSDLNHWVVEERQGKAVLRTYREPARYLRYNANAEADANVDLADWARAYEEWRPIKNDDGSWSLKGVFDKFLSVGADGSVGLSRNHTESAHFRFETAADPVAAPPTAAAILVNETAGGHVYFKACDFHGKNRIYLRAWNGHPSIDVDMGPWRMKWEQWYVEEHGDKVALRSYTGMFLSATAKGSVDLVEKPQKSELWAPVKNDDGSWSFQNAHGTYLSGHLADGPVITMPHNKACEHFQLERDD